MSGRVVLLDSNAAIASIAARHEHHARSAALLDRFVQRRDRSAGCFDRRTSSRADCVGTSVTLHARLHLQTFGR